MTPTPEPRPQHSAWSQHRPPPARPLGVRHQVSPWRVRHADAHPLRTSHGRSPRSPMTRDLVGTAVGDEEVKHVVGDPGVCQRNGRPVGWEICECHDPGPAASGPSAPLSTAQCCFTHETSGRRRAGPRPESAWVRSIMRVTPATPPAGGPAARRCTRGSRPRPHPCPTGPYPAPITWSSPLPPCPIPTRRRRHRGTRPPVRPP
jgi:hypothetical protein